MKKTILFAATIFMASVLQAQDKTVQEPGNKMWLSGSVAFDNYSDDADTKETYGIFSPGFGYCINSKLAVGLGLSYASDTYEEKFGTVTEETKMTEFSVAPFFRYYKSLGENCSLYGELNVAFGSGKSEFDNGTNTSEDTYGFFQTKIAPGIQYWVHKNWSVNAEWGALRYRADNDKADSDLEEDFKSSEFVVGLDMSSISFGVNFHF